MDNETTANNSGSNLDNTPVLDSFEDSDLAIKKVSIVSDFPSFDPRDNLKPRTAGPDLLKMLNMMARYPGKILCFEYPTKKIAQCRVVSLRQKLSMDGIDCRVSRLGCNVYVG